MKKLNESESIDAAIKDKQIKLENVESALKVAMADEYEKFKKKQALLDKSLLEIEGDRKKVEELSKKGEAELKLIAAEKNKLKNYLQEELIQLKQAKKDIETREKALKEERNRLDSSHVSYLNECLSLTDAKHELTVEKRAFSDQKKAFQEEKKVYDSQKDKQAASVEKGLTEAQNKLESAKQTLALAVEKDAKIERDLINLENRTLELNHLKAQVLHVAKSNSMKKEIEALSKI